MPCLAELKIMIIRRYDYSPYLTVEAIDALDAVRIAIRDLYGSSSDEIPEIDGRMFYRRLPVAQSAFDSAQKIVNGLPLFTMVRYE